MRSPVKRLFTASPKVAAASASPAAGLDARGQPELRLVLVRHAQSANKRRAGGEEASKDPRLSDHGLQQADSLSHRLLDFLAERRVDRRSGLLVVSSPMLRCLLTIQPALDMLRLPPGCCVCHGACYEYGCAGSEFRGSSQESIVSQFEDFEAVGFGSDGRWDCRSEGRKEEDAEFVARGARVVKWLREEGLVRLRALGAEGSTPPTLVLTTHQTFGDLLCHLLLEGSAAGWEYGDVRYRMQNAALTEILLYSDGRAELGVRNG